MNQLARGYNLEARYGTLLPRGSLLPHGFRTIDFFDRASGMATSFKSIDLAAPAYQNAGTFSRVLNGYVASTSGFNGGSRAAELIDAGDIQSRSLVVAIPGFPSASQWDATAQAVQAGSAAQNSVAVQFVVMPG